MSITTNALLLGRGDLLPSYRDIPLNLLEVEMFSMHQKPFNNHGLIIFIDENYETLILKNRYGNKGIVTAKPLEGGV